MYSKTLVAMAVASACAWPAFATAQNASHSGHWEVATPSAVNESAPWLAAETTLSGAAQVTASYAEPLTPSSVNESAPWLAAEEVTQRPAAARPRIASLPNPQTPWAPNESGAAHYAEDMRAHVEQIAAVEHARIAAAAHEAETLAHAATDAGASVAGMEFPAGAFPGELPESERAPDLSVGLLDTRQTTTGAQLVPEGIPGDRPEGERLPEGGAGLIDTRQSTGGEFNIEGAEAGGLPEGGSPADASLGAQTLSEAPPLAMGFSGAATGAETSAEDAALLSADAAAPNQPRAEASAQAQSAGLAESGAGMGDVAQPSGAAGGGFTPGTGMTRSEGPTTEMPGVLPRTEIPGPVDDTSQVRRDPDAAQFARDAATSDAPTPAEAPAVGSPGHIPGYADVTIHAAPEGGSAAR